MPFAPFPHHYTVALSGDQVDAGPRAPIRVGSPPEFGGTDDVWSPEHLIVAAALSCLKATFDAYARRQQLQVRQWRGSGTATLAKAAPGPVFTNIVLEVAIETEPGEEERARALLATAERNCIVSRALTAPVVVSARVVAAPERAA